MGDPFECYVCGALNAGPLSDWPCGHLPPLAFLVRLGIRSERIRAPRARKAPTLSRTQKRVLGWCTAQRQAPTIDQVAAHFDCSALEAAEFIRSIRARGAELPMTGTLRVRGEQPRDH